MSSCRTKCSSNYRNNFINSQFEWSSQNHKQEISEKQFLKISNLKALKSHWILLPQFFCHNVHIGTHFFMVVTPWPTFDYTEMRQLCWTGTVTSPYNSWSRGDRGMKIWSKVALDATLADTKFQGSGYTGSRVVPIIRLIFDQFFQSSECSKS